jgi:hypothetical protein
MASIFNVMYQFCQSQSQAQLKKEVGEEYTWTQRLEEKSFAPAVD